MASIICCTAFPVNKVPSSFVLPITAVIIIAINWSTLLWTINAILRSAFSGWCRNLECLSRPATYNAEPGYIFAQENAPTHTADIVKVRLL